MNKKRIYIISSTLLLIGLFAGVVQYVGTFDALYAAATNPGHSWSQMECSEDLCIDAANHKVTIKNLQLNGMLYDTTGYSASDSASLRLTGEGIRWDEPLTWTGSTHGLIDCSNIGGTVFDTGSGTICRIRSATVPTGWTQAGYWQKYAVATYGNDACGRHGGPSSPTEWSNAAAFCPKLTYYSDNAGRCTGATGFWHASSSPNNPAYTITNDPVCSTNRIEVGIY